MTIMSSSEFEAVVTQIKLRVDRALSERGSAPKLENVGRELNHIFANSEPALVITEGESRELLEAANSETGAPLIDLDEDGPGGYEGKLAQASERNPVTLHDLRSAVRPNSLAVSSSTPHMRGMAMKPGPAAAARERSDAP